MRAKHKKMRNTEWGEKATANATILGYVCMTYDCCSLVSKPQP